ncbi:MAG: AMP-binding protein [Proteobacteria bacterium]|nr:AMP-binding protein [Pseudomonadota bacterium]
MSQTAFGASGQADGYARDRLPPPALWPRMDYTVLPELAAYPAHLNAAVELLDRMQGDHADRPALHFSDQVWSYADLLNKANRIARVLAEDFGLVPGGRVLLRAPNNPMLVACWFAVLKAGGICVATMPMLRAGELKYIIDKANTAIALCDMTIAEDLEAARRDTGALEHMAYFSAAGDSSSADAGLERAMEHKDGNFSNIETSADDISIIAFTSGTTGSPKGTVHFHRDLLATADTYARRVLKVEPSDIFCVTAPLAFTFGLGALVLFPMRFGASTVLVERFAADTMLKTIERYGCTGIYTAPTGYRAMVDKVDRFDISSLRLCVSAGEHLPKAIWAAWHGATGLGILDGIGATEVLHIFISSSADAIRPGSTGQVVPGYAAKILDPSGTDAPRGDEGLLAVRGPTGCRYLDDEERQKAYVRDAWNLTGDVFREDTEGYFWFVARADDMIISSGYNISGPEVENAVLGHAAVLECAVIGVPDEGRGQIVKAYVVLKETAEAGPGLVRDIQDFVKARIAPYKYPRAVEFVDALPKTQTGKLQRYKLREGTP